MRTPFAVKAFLVIVLIASSTTASALSASPTRGGRPPSDTLMLSAYQQADGAISVYPDGRLVEPYFAMRALITAADLGLETSAAAQRWIAWQLQRLDEDSTFKKYCRAPGGIWTACGTVDADDATLALWIELLYGTAGSHPMPAAWRASVTRAERQLARLYDAQRGVYVISLTLPVSLFMDNIEVLSATETVARANSSAGRHIEAIVVHDRAVRLQRAIDRVFWNDGLGLYAVSTQGSQTAPAFYPDVVAQIFPAIFGHGSPREGPAQLVSHWMSEHGREWIAEGAEEYPWGLVAIAAMRYGDRASTVCWFGAAMSLRFGVRWNVLEEATYQALIPAVSIGGAAPPCAASWFTSP